MLELCSERRQILTMEKQDVSQSDMLAPHSTVLWMPLLTWHTHWFVQALTLQQAFAAWRKGDYSTFQVTSNIICLRSTTDAYSDSSPALNVCELSI